MNIVTIPVQHLEITLEENAVVSDIKKALKMIKGIASVRVAKSARTISSKAVSTVADVPNEETLAAIRELESGHNAGVVQMDSIDTFISSIAT